MSDFTVVSSSDIYKVIIKYLNHGSATTKETLILEKKGVEFEVDFDLTFTYDWSNGMEMNEPEIKRIVKNNGKKHTTTELTMIKLLIKQLTKNGEKDAD